MAVKGFIELPITLESGKESMLNVRPEAIAMYGEEDGRTLIWFDVMDNSLKIPMTIEDFEYMMEQESYNF